MKKIKTGLFFIIIISMLFIIYQNHEYFFAKNSLIIDLRIDSLQWVIPEFMNIGYFGISFCLGFLIAGYMGISSKLKSRKVVKKLTHDIDSYHEQVISLKTELDKFHNDPYIKDNKDDDKDLPVEQTQTT